MAAVGGFFFLIRIGVKEAAWINTIVTAAKLLPLLLFIVLVVFFFKPDVFVANLSGGYDVPGGRAPCSTERGPIRRRIGVRLCVGGSTQVGRSQRSPGRSGETLVGVMRIRISGAFRRRP